MPDSNHNSATPRVFEMGLVMAGAVSAGSYSAGVLDFLVEALDAYEEARQRPDWTGPRHAVKLKVITGTSAGGITAALGAGALFRDFAHVRGPAPAKGANPLYDAWVEQVDLTELLGTNDLKNDQGIRSLLDSTVIDRVADGAIRALGKLPLRARPWVSDPLPVVLTATNLRGLPYGFDLFGTGSNATYGMMSHADDVSFCVGTRSAPQNHLISVDATAPDPSATGWDALVATALATGAFPIGLAARRITAPTIRYRHRPRMSAPAFGDTTWAETHHSFTAVDGGVIDNEPMEIARNYLTGIDEEAGDRAHSAILMIDPFPNEIDRDPLDAETTELSSIARKLIGALIAQARFKADEMNQVIDPDVYSRFVISPSRRVGTTTDRKPVNLATGQLGGFSGFFAKSFRRHDYLLGRRNCQSFLKRYFVLPEVNRLFDSLPAAQRDDWHARERDGTLRLISVSNDDATKHKALPVIPLTEELSADIEIPAADVPPAGMAAVDMPRLTQLMVARANALIDLALDGVLVRKWYRVDHKVVRWFARGRIRDKVMTVALAEIEKSLSRWTP